MSDKNLDVFGIADTPKEEVKEVREKQVNVKIKRIRGQRDGFYLYSHGKETRLVPFEHGGERSVSLTEKLWKSFKQEK